MVYRHLKSSFIKDKEGCQIEVTDLDKALTQANSFRFYRHKDDAHPALDQSLQGYWKDIYLKLLQLKFPERKLFYFQINPIANFRNWEDVPVIAHLLLDNAHASALAGRVSRFFQADVLLISESPALNNRAHFRCI